MKHKAVKTIEKYNMFKQGEEITVGFSGGADSVALLYLLYSLKDEYNLSLKAVHLNHLLRGDESFRDERFVVKFCKQLDIDLAVERLDIIALSEETGLSIEETARKERYKLFEKVAGNGKIATAHSLSDNLETVIFNLTRGTGIEGLTGIPPVRDNIIRPVIECTRAEIEEYCDEHELKYVTDSTNLSTDYNRNKIRHNIIPVMKEINPSVENVILTTTEILKQDSAYMDGISAEKMRKIFSSDKGYKRQDFIKLHYSIKSRIIRQILADLNLEYSYNRINMILDKILDIETGMQLSADYFLKVSDEFFQIEKKKKKTPYFSVECNIEDITNLKKISIATGKKVELKVIECKEFENISNICSDRLKNLLDYDKMGEVIIFRQRKPGDKIRLMGRNGTKTVKKLFNEYKVPLEQREKLIVLESNREVLWVEGFGVDENFAVKKDTQKALELKLK